MVRIFISQLGKGTFLFRLFLLLTCCDSHQIIGAAGLILVLVFELLFHLLGFRVGTILHSHQVHLLYVFHLMLLRDKKALVVVVLVLVHQWINLHLLDFLHFAHSLRVFLLVDKRLD